MGQHILLSGEIKGLVLEITRWFIMRKQLHSIHKNGPWHYHEYCIVYWDNEFIILLSHDNKAQFSHDNRLIYFAISKNRRPISQDDLIIYQEKKLSRCAMTAGFVVVVFLFSPYLHRPSFPYPAPSSLCVCVCVCVCLFCSSLITCLCITPVFASLTSGLCFWVQPKTKTSQNNLDNMDPADTSLQLLDIWDIF